MSKYLLVAIAGLTFASSVTAQVHEPQKPPPVRIRSISDLVSHIGEFPCSNGLLTDPILLATLKPVLRADYDAFLKHMSLSGCGAIVRRGPFLLMDVSQLHVGGYSSLVFVDPSTRAAYVFWLRGQVKDKKYGLYGSEPVPSVVRQTIVDEMNQTWGHVARFSWSGDALRIDVR